MKTTQIIHKDKTDSIIKVLGVGGGGCNAVAHMYDRGIVGVDFAVCNTDFQSLELNPVPHKIILGPNLTQGHGAGSKPEIGKQACLETEDEIRDYLTNNTKMLFITAGMGGGTGTGAAPIVAKIARELEILTVAIVTLPFQFEGLRRQTHALAGLNELQENVDALLVISNERVKEIYESLPLSEAFKNADLILTTAAKGIAEIITVTGHINVDFEDVNTVMRNSGVAIMGSAITTGEERAKKAIQTALTSPLLEDNDIQGAKDILVNITSGKKEATMEELKEITEYIQRESGAGANMILGICRDESLNDELSITVIATGFKHSDTYKIDQTSIEGKGHQQMRQNVNTLDDMLGGNLNKNIQPTKTSTIGNNTSTHKVNFGDFDHLGNHNLGKVAKQQSKIYNRNTDPVYIQESTNETTIEQKNLQWQSPSSENHIDETIKNNGKELVYLDLNDLDILNNIEKKPAYQRQGVKLVDVNYNNEVARSNMKISSNEEHPFRETGNSYLLDNVD